MIINGNLKLNESNITSLGKLKEVNGYLDLNFSEDLEYVEGLIYLDIGSNITKEYVKKYKPQLFKQCRWNKETPNYA